MTVDMKKRVDALERLVKAKSLMDDDAGSAYHEQVTQDWTSANGARLCAKAWTDPAFRQRLLTDELTCKLYLR